MILFCFFLSFFLFLFSIFFGASSGLSCASLFGVCESVLGFLVPVRSVFYSPRLFKVRV